MSDPIVNVERVCLYAIPIDLEEIEIDSPTPVEVATSISKIDGETHDQLSIEGRRNNTRIQIGVIGGHGQLVAMHIFDGEETHYLRTADGGSNHDYSLVSSGGTQVDVLSRWLVSVDRAARGLWYFLLTGGLDPALTWDQLSDTHFKP